MDTDKQPAREVINKYMQEGYSYLFDEQVISYNTQHRDANYDLILGAVRRAIDYERNRKPDEKSAVAKNAARIGQGSKAGYRS